jgi:translation initiation factor IF-1
MKKHNLIEMKCIVTKSLRNDNGCEVLTHILGKIRHNYIRILPRDGVKIVLNPYDPTKRHIIHQLLAKSPNG